MAYIGPHLCPVEAAFTCRPKVFGGLVWMLVASTGVVNEILMGWVMFVSVFCFVMTTLWFFIFLCGANRSSSWPALDVAYHFVATVFYLGASVPLAFITVVVGQGLAVFPALVALAPVLGLNPDFLIELPKIYKLYIAAVDVAYHFVATVFYLSASVPLAFITLANTGFYKLHIAAVVFGGLVWMLVASAGVYPVLVMSWVMFVSIFCFVMTTLWFFIFLCGANRSSSWPALDVAYHFVATVFYLGASVPLAFITVVVGQRLPVFPALVALAPVLGLNPYVLIEAPKIYKLYIAAVVMSYLATLFYFIHTIFSAIRWKRS